LRGISCGSNKYKQHRKILSGCIGTLGTALATGILAPKDTSDSPKFTIKHLIATVGTPSSKQRVETALSEHSARLTVLTQEENVRAAQNADVVLLTVKPIKQEDVFSIPGFKEAIRGKIVISIIAGITTAEVAVGFTVTTTTTISTATATNA
jgi:pyrroline-5-carboxylate reductase